MRSLSLYKTKFIGILAALVLLVASAAPVLADFFAFGFDKQSYTAGDKASFFITGLNPNVEYTVKQGTKVVAAGKTGEVGPNGSMSVNDSFTVSGSGAEEFDLYLGADDSYAGSATVQVAAANDPGDGGGGDDIIGDPGSEDDGDTTGQRPVVRSALGCDRNGENCQSNKVAQGQVLVVTVSGLTDSQLDNASITLDNVSFPTQIENSTTGRISTTIPDDVEFGEYSLSVTGRFTTAVYPGGITVTRASTTGGGDDGGGGDDTDPNNPRPSGQTGGGILGEGLKTIEGVFPSGSELTKSRTIGEIIVAVIKILLGLLFAVTVLFIILGGFQYVTSAGNEDQAKKGRKTLLYAIIGLVIVILAYVLVNVVVSAVSSSSL